MWVGCDNRITDTEGHDVLTPRSPFQQMWARGERTETRSSPARGQMLPQGVC